MHLGGAGRVLQQLDQAVFQHHLAGGGCDVAADHEFFRAGGWRAACLALQVVHQVLHAAHQVGAAFRHRAPQHHRVGKELVAGREHVQHLPGHEADHVFVVLFHAPDTVRCLGPPLLVEQKGLVHEVERPLLPFRVTKAPVAGGHWHGMAQVAVETGLQAFTGVACHQLGFLQRQLREVHAFAWGRGQVQGPVGDGHQRRGMRDGGQPARHEGMEPGVPLFCHGNLRLPEAGVQRVRGGCSFGRCRGNHRQHRQRRHAGHCGQHRTELRGCGPGAHRSGHGTLGGGRNFLHGTFPARSPWVQTWVRPCGPEDIVKIRLVGI